MAVDAVVVLHTLIVRDRDERNTARRGFIARNHAPSTQATSCA